MPQTDLLLYQSYRERRRFPARRIELLLAQVPMVIAQLKGVDARLDSFLFDEVPRPVDDEPATEEDAAAVAAALNFTPRKRPPRKDNGDEQHGQQPG